MSTVDILKTLRQDLDGKPHEDIKRAAKAMGVPYHTLRKYVAGYRNNPTLRTAEKIRRYYLNRGHA